MVKEYKVMIEELKELTNLDGPSGFENEVREYIKKKLEKHLEIKVDKIGNVIAKNESNKQPHVLICAHMDEVGFVIQDITEDGFIKVAPIGGWDERILLGMPVRILGKRKIIGVFSTLPPHILKAEEAMKVQRIEDCHIDTGLTKKELLEEGIDIGTFVTPHSNFIINKNIIITKALDDRVGCALLIEIAEKIKSFDYSIVLGATVQEEIGSRGAKVLVNQVDPDFAIILECTVAADIPGVESHRQPTALKKGPALTLIDKTMIADKSLFDKALLVAKEKGIQYQIKKPIYGGTDAGAIHIAGTGIPSLVISCPARYIHSASSLTTIENLEETKRLVLAILEEIINKF